MKVGVFLTHRGESGVGSDPTWQDAPFCAELAESIGADSIWVLDHLQVTLIPNTARSIEHVALAPKTLCG